MVNNRYVTADLGSVDTHLIANRDSPGAWEQFTVVPIGDGVAIALLTVNGKYVSVREDNVLRAMGDTIGPWEMFVWADAGGGATALQSLKNSQWVSADGAGTLPLIADRSTPGIWESFLFSDPLPTPVPTPPPLPTGPKHVMLVLGSMGSAADINATLSSLAPFTHCFDQLSWGARIIFPPGADPYHNLFLSTEAVNNIPALIRGSFGSAMALWPAIVNGDLGALNAVMANMGPWIARAVDTAKSEGYAGYILDFEPQGVNPFMGDLCKSIMIFLREFTNAMHAAALGLKYYFLGPNDATCRAAFASSPVDGFVTMQTYGDALPAYKADISDGVGLLGGKFAVGLQSGPDGQPPFPSADVAQRFALLRHTPVTNILFFQYLTSQPPSATWWTQMLAFRTPANHSCDSGSPRL